MADIAHPVFLIPVPNSEAFPLLSRGFETSATISSDHHCHAISETVNNFFLRQKLTEICLFQ